MLLITLRDGRWQEIDAVPTDPEAFLPAYPSSIWARALAGWAAAGAIRPGSNVAQARDFLRDASESYGIAHYEEAFRLAPDHAGPVPEGAGGASDLLASPYIKQAYLGL